MTHRSGINLLRWAGVVLFLSDFYPFWAACNCHQRRRRCRPNRCPLLAHCNNPNITESEAATIVADSET
jgi:hypothetical protein